MNPRDFLLSPVDLTITQDWDPVVKLAQSLIEKSKTHHTEVVPHGNATFYHLGNLGSVSHHHVSGGWHNVVLNSAKKYLTWLPKMLSDMAELGPTWAISIMTTNGALHVDYDTYPAAVNYPINTTKAETYILYKDNEYTYPSIKDAPWMLATGAPHGVRNTELRLVFNLHFSASYSEVRTWFDQHPNLVYS